MIHDVLSAMIWQMIPRGDPSVKDGKALHRTKELEKRIRRTKMWDLEVSLWNIGGSCHEQELTELKHSLLIQV